MYKGELLIGPCPVCGKEARSDTDTVVMYEEESDADPAHVACLLLAGGGQLAYVNFRTGAITPLGPVDDGKPAN